MLRVIVMGVCGSGKTRIGNELSLRLGVPYIEGDDLHPESNVAKMSQGIPLDDEDRWPWLDRVATTLNERAPAIISCSALKRAYRDRIRALTGGPVRIVYLSGSKQTIATRLNARKDHFMPPALLDSQLAALEAPGEDEALTVDISRSVATLVDIIMAELDSVESRPPPYSA